MGNLFIDFKWVVANADVEAVLAGLDVQIARHAGAEIRIHCPLHDDETSSCSINTETTKWMCHAGCGDGDVIELVSLALDTDKRSAASKIAEWSGTTVADPAGRKSRAAKPSGNGRKKPAIKGEKPPAPSEKPPAKEWQPYTTRLPPRIHRSLVQRLPGR